MRTKAYSSFLRAKLVTMHGVHGQVRIRNIRDRILGSEVVKIHICAAPDIGNFYKKTVRNIH